MLWIELAACRVGIVTVCIVTDRQNTAIIRMSAKIDCQLRQVCLSIFLSAWEESATTGKNFREM